VEEGLSKTDVDKWESPPHEARQKPIVDRLVETVQSRRGLGSENTGDIVLLANMDGGFYLDGGDLTSTHGSLSARDGLVPLAFAYPGATSKVEGEDTLLAKVRAFLQAGTGGPAAAFKIPTEANSARCFLGLIPCQ